MWRGSLPGNPVPTSIDPLPNGRVLAPACAACRGLNALLKRLQRNSQLGIIVLLGLTTAFTLALFAAYRALHGQWAAAIVDFSIVVLICAPVFHAMRTGNAAGPGAFLCITNSLGCAVACYVIGPAALPWVYLVLMTNFFIAGSRQALSFNL